MQVETFECTETASEPIEATEEAIELMKSLGMEGQLGLTKKDDNGNDTRCPYREMTADELFVYGVLCPAKYEVSDYDLSPIPLRVLQIASHAKSLDMFDKLVIWDRESAAVVDPVLVGNIRTKGQFGTSDDKTYILARWGATLDSFVTLLDQATKAKRESLKAEYQSIAAKVNADLASVDTMTTSELVKRGAGRSPSYYDF